MYYQNYEDYMRAVLGYPIESQNTYRMDYLGELSTNNMLLYQNTKELEECYPEIYKIINPVVCEVCDRCNIPITRNVVDNMVEEIYQKIHLNNEILININIDNNVSEKQIENRINNIKPNISKNNINEQTRKVSDIENRQRRPNNPFLRDLIRILILNRLLSGNFPNRPPRPRPPRPQPRDYEIF